MKYGKKYVKNVNGNFIRVYDILEYIEYMEYVYMYIFMNFPIFYYILQYIMNTNITSPNSEVSNILEKYKIDNTQYYLVRFIKFIVNILLIYIFIELLFANMESLSKLQVILIISVYCSVVLYILDNIFYYIIIYTK